MRSIPASVLAVVTCVAALAIAITATTAIAQPVPVGSEFLVNTYTSSTEEAAAVCHDDAGNFVVVWHSGFGFGGPDGSGLAIRGQRFDSSGTSVGSEFQVNSYTTGTQDYPDVCCRPDGSFITVWASEAQDGSISGVFGRAFGSSGSPLGSEFQVNAYTTGAQHFPAVACDGGGNFIVAWTGEGAGDNFGTFGRRFDSAANPLGLDFQVNTVTTSYQGDPDVAASALGDFVVVWSGGSSSGSIYNQDGSGEGIFAQRFNSSGAPSGTEFQVNTYTTGTEEAPAVSMGCGGDFVVAWDGPVGPYRGILAQRFDSSGAAVGTEFRVDPASGDASAAAIAFDDAHGVVVAWQNDPQDGDATGVVARQFAVDGTPQGSEFQVNTYTTNTQQDVSVSLAPNGDCVVTWASDTQDGISSDVYAQRYSVPAIGCASAPLTCSGPGKAVIIAKKDVGDPNKNKLLWKWLRGNVSNQSAFGNPIAATGYHLCVYDSGPLVEDYAIDAAGTCSGDACWKPVGTKGFKYKIRPGTLRASRTCC